MRKKRTISLLTALILAFCLCFNARYVAAATGHNPDVDAILAHFAELNKIPRQSLHEQAVSDYLLQWAKSKGFKVVKDAYNNVIIDKPLIGKPLTILQAHTDMVCIAEDGYSFDPQKDAIKTQNDGEFITAVKTSLGADDGIGVAMALRCLETVDNINLRVVFTANEEDGMTGAENIVSSYFKDAAYLFNLDGEESWIATISSAGMIDMDTYRNLSLVATKGKLGLRIRVRGLKGGHSGMEINSGLQNAIEITGVMLQRLKDSGVSYELASIEGGSARNAVPQSCEAVIVISEKNKVAVQKTVSDVIEAYKASFIDTEPKMAAEVSQVKRPNIVMSEDDKNSVLNFITLCHNGVFSMSQKVEGLVESSSNLGTISTKDTKVSIGLLARSCEDVLLRKFEGYYATLAKVSGFDVDKIAYSPGWSAKKDNMLLDMLSQTYTEIDGGEIEKIAVHAGLECGYFVAKNPNMDIVSIGPDVTGAHTTLEKLAVNSIDKAYRVLLGTLDKIAAL